MAIACNGNISELATITIPVVVVVVVVVVLVIDVAIEEAWPRLIDCLFVICLF